MRLPIVSAVALACLSVASASFAQMPPPPPPASGGGGGGGGGIGGDASFGAAHQLAISSDANVSLLFSSTNAPGSNTSTEFLLAPAADFFVIDNLSVGGQVIFSSFSPGGGGNSSTTIGLGPRVGYNIGFNPMFSFWPKGGFTIGSESFAGRSQTVFTLNIFAPFLFHPTEHFFLGLGPMLNTDLSGDLKTTQYGLAFTVGGWMGF
jgi:hypothetical protein